MVPYNQVVNGVTKYIDDEIISKINGWQKWLIGTGVGIAISKGETLIKQLKMNPIVQMLGIITEDNMIDIATIYEELKKQAAQGPITFSLPTVGNITFTENDVNKVYTYITQNGGVLNETN